MTWMIFASPVLGSLHMAHNLNAKKWVETIVNGSYYSAKLNATRLGLIKSLYSRRAKNCWSFLIHLVFPDPWPPGLWLDNWAWKPNIKEQNDPMESYVCMCIYIYIHMILHIVKYIESLECNKLCTNHFGTSHAVSLLQSFIALRLFFTSLADEIASELQRWSCSEAEQGRIYNNELYTQYMGGNYNIYI